MSISTSEWNSATDPFVESDTGNFGTPTVSLPQKRVGFTIDGGYTGPGSEKERAYGFLVKTTDPDFVVEAPILYWAGVLGSQIDQRRGSTQVLEAEFGGYEKDSGDGSASDSFFMRERHGPSAGVTQYLLFPSMSGAGITYFVEFQMGFLWFDKDPAQVIMAMMIHYNGTTIAGVSLRNYLNQGSFQDASDYYDDMPLPLSMLRESGKTILDQCLEVIEQTGGDLLSIRPNDSTGVMQLHIIPRRIAEVRDEVIDLDAIDGGVFEYEAMPTDRHHVDSIVARYGTEAVYGYSSAISTTEQGYDFELNADSATHRQARVEIRANNQDDGNVVDFDLPYVQLRRHVFGHHDIGFWKDDAIEIRFKIDSRHFNFECGDIVLIDSARKGLSSQKALVVEKTVDLDDLTAEVEILTVYGLEGKPPEMVGDPFLLFRPNSLGKRRNGDEICGSISEKTRELDRWEDESGRLTHAIDADVGSGGPFGNPPASPTLLDDGRNGWPVLDDMNELGFFIRSELARLCYQASASATGYTIFAVINGKDPSGTADQYIVKAADWGVLYSGNPAGNVVFDDGGTQRGSQTSVTGWQILTFILDSTGATIRRDGADLETGLSYTNRATSGDVGIFCSDDGNTATFQGQGAEVIVFDSVLTSTQVDDIEAHLAEKYAIDLP